MWLRLGAGRRGQLSEVPWQHGCPTSNSGLLLSLWREILKEFLGRGATRQPLLSTKPRTAQNPGRAQTHLQLNLPGSRAAHVQNNGQQVLP